MLLPRPSRLPLPLPLCLPPNPEPSLPALTSLSTSLHVAAPQCKAHSTLTPSTDFEGQPFGTPSTPVNTRVRPARPSHPDLHSPQSSSCTMLTAGGYANNQCSGNTELCKHLTATFATSARPSKPSLQCPDKLLVWAICTALSAPHRKALTAQSSSVYLQGIICARDCTVGTTHSPICSALMTSGSRMGVTYSTSQQFLYSPSS